MKALTVKLILMLLAVCMLIPIFASCGNSGKDSASTDEVLSTAYNAIYFKTFTVDENNTAYCKVPNNTEEFDFSKEMEISGAAKYGVYLDEYCSLEVKTKTVPLVSGDNTFYIWAENTDKGEIMYTVTIRVKPMYEVTFDTAGGTEVEKQIIEEDALAIQPTTTKAGYIFAGWDFDFSTPITENKHIVASWTADSDTVTLNKNGGAGGTDSITVAFGAPMPKPILATNKFLGKGSLSAGGISCTR